MPTVIDISKTHGMGTARVMEQFGFPRSFRKFITEYVNWLTTKIYLNEFPDIQRLREAVSILVKTTPFLHTRHVIHSDKDLLYFEEYDPEYNYLQNGTEMLKIYVQNTTIIVATSHVVTDLKSSFLIGKELEQLYRGEHIHTESIDQMVVFNEFATLFENQTDISRKPRKWRFLNISVNRVENSYTKHDFLLREMKEKKVTTLKFEEIYNTSKLYNIPVRGCTTIATLLHTIHCDEEASGKVNVKSIKEQLDNSYTLDNIEPNTFTSKYIYNFIRTDTVFNSVLTHLLLSSVELPAYVYRMFNLFLPMKNDTTEQIKIVFQNEVFGSIVINITLH